MHTRRLALFYNSFWNYNMSIMIHLSGTPKVSEPVSLTNATTAEWTNAAVKWYQQVYNFCERSEKDSKKLEKQWKNLVASMPMAYRTGIHLLAEQAAFMGEDIYLVDGKVQHPIHVECTSCQQYTLVYRKSKLYCITCQGKV